MAGAKGVICPQCGTDKAGVDKTTHKKPAVEGQQGYTEREKTCKNCGTRLQTAEVFVQILPPK